MKISTNTATLEVMLPRSKGALVFLIALPILLVIPLRQAALKRPRVWCGLATIPASLALSGDGSVVAFTENNGVVGMWPDGGTYQKMQAGVGIGNGMVSASPPELRFVTNGETLLSSNIHISLSSTALYAWNAKTRDIKWTALTNSEDDYNRYWISPDGQRAVQRANDIVTVLDISGEGASQPNKKSPFTRAFPVLSRFKARASEPNGKTSRLQTLALSTDGKTVVGATQHGQLEFWDTLTGKRRLQTPPTGTTTSADCRLQYSPDGRFVALFDGTTISVWEIATGKWSSTIVASASTEHDLAWMPDSQSLWTGAGTVQQWSVPSMKRLRDLPVNGPVAVSGDGRTLVTRSARSTFSAGIWAWNID